MSGHKCPPVAVLGHLIQNSAAAIVAKEPFNPLNLARMICKMSPRQLLRLLRIAFCGRADFVQTKQVVG